VQLQAVGPLQRLLLRLLLRLSQSGRLQPIDRRRLVALALVLVLAPRLHLLESENPSQCHLTSPRLRSGSHRSGRHRWWMFEKQIEKQSFLQHIYL